MSFSRVSLSIVAAAILLPIAFVLLHAPAWMDVSVCILIGVVYPFADPIVFGPFLSRKPPVELRKEKLLKRLTLHVILCITLSVLLCVAVSHRGVLQTIIAIVLMQLVVGSAVDAARLWRQLRTQRPTLP